MLRSQEYHSDYFKTFTRGGEHFQDSIFYKPMVRNLIVTSRKLDLSFY